MKNTRVGVDLAKNVIQVCIVKGNKVIVNKEMTPEEFALWLITTQPTIIIFEACGSSNYWKQKALEAGHDARLISAKLVATVRQNQKTDANDALAIIQASQLAQIKFINGKNFEQQELQSIMRMRELAVKNKKALRQQIQSLLLEFNIRISSRSGGLNGVVQKVLEDAENGFEAPFRSALHTTWQAYLSAVSNIVEYDRCLNKAIQSHPNCKKLMQLEGVGEINAVNLYIQLGCGEAGNFKTGSDAAACLGLTPMQHSSGGKTQLGHINKFIKNGSVRSYLVTGAMAVIRQVIKREPKTTKERWLKALVERRGAKCAAVALANKTIRTAFAMISKGTEYQAQPLTA